MKIETKMSQENIDFLRQKFPDISEAEFEVLKEFFALKVLGVLDSISAMKEYDPQFATSKEGIYQFFVNKKLNGDMTLFNKWQKELKKEIKRIGRLATKERQAGFGGRREFLTWYLQIPKRCDYCGITEKEYAEARSKLLKSKDKRRNSFCLEIEKIIPDLKPGYCKDNCVLACYLCNNDKSDIFTAEEYRASDFPKKRAEYLKKIIKNNRG